MTDDLTTLRARALWYQEQGWLTHTVKIEDHLALLDRLERAEAAIKRTREAVITGHDGGRCGVKEHSKSSAASEGYKRCARFVLAALDTGKETGE